MLCLCPTGIFSWLDLSATHSGDGKPDVDKGIGKGSEKEECFIKWTPHKLLTGMKGIHIFVFIFMWFW